MSDGRLRYVLTTSPVVWRTYGIRRGTVLEVQDGDDLRHARALIAAGLVERLDAPGLWPMFGVAPLIAAGILRCSGC
jgi:hypothetical protein